MSIDKSLNLKYSLQHLPTDSEIKEWLNKTNIYISKGKSKEEAGNLAAKDIFSDYGTYFRESKADDIEALLALALKKVQNGQ